MPATFACVRLFVPLTSLTDAIQPHRVSLIWRLDASSNPLTIHTPSGLSHLLRHLRDDWAAGRKAWFEFLHGDTH